MFGNRKLAKRSIIGTRVAALRQDGRYYPGFIQSQTAEEGFVTCSMFIVKFDDGKSKELSPDGIFGPGFRQMTDANLKNGQKVYVTLNGREVSATVITQDEDNVLITVTQMDGEQRQMVKRVDEVRLYESRKSARLADMDTDYSKLADIQLSEPKKRPVSHVIDVPAKSRRERRHLDSTYDSEDDDVDMSDEKEHMAAAFVLTSLSSSPASPCFPQSLKEKDFLHGPCSFHDYHLSSSAASSGFESGQSERSDRSPPLSSLLLSGSAPTNIQIRSPTPNDDCLDLEEDVKQFYDDQADTKEKGLRTVFKCQWRGCGQVHKTTEDITKHVRKAHFGRDSDAELSDEEEDFYYNEIQVDMEQVTRQFADLHTSSPPNIPPQPSHSIPIGIFDHDYQRKEHKQPAHIHASSVPSSGVIVNQGGSLPISIPADGQIKRSLSWQSEAPPLGSVTSSPVRFARPSPQVRLQQHQAQSPKSHMFASPPKASGMHRKPRSEVRKCRKVYGMENRDSWCTQCKWKKACTRFLD